MTAPEWVAYSVVLAIHEAQLAEHGGSAGIRDEGLLQSALARPQNVYAYSETATLYDLAAAYAIGLAKNHPFIDGNKRTAWVVCAVFLELNGISVVIAEQDVVSTMLDVADGTIDEQAFSRRLQEPGSTRP
ncbi:MAG: type II toxin-antitoxin system death-on-curing family toxin [Acidobacteriaceae bacterium]|nr:type II toxin-antitoxin system death-on-curing family toxin [Acidobacteriaceae bacterium]